MAFSATFFISSTLSFNLSSTKCKPFSSNSFNSILVSASSYTTTPISKKQTVPFKKNNWQWKFCDSPINIYFEEHVGKSSDTCKNILMVPTISDVSTVEEWRSVAGDVIQRQGKTIWRTTIVDWPGLGYFDRPKMDYNVDTMEQFLADFINAPDGPLNNSGDELVIIGGGHAATVTLRAAKKGLLKPTAITAVAPTWAGPLPIVFGRDSSMEMRYGLLRGTLQAPALGWMMYNMLVSNEKAIQSQYKSHVYANPDNVTPEIIESRYALTKRKGARYAPAAFLTGLLDPVKTREEFLELFADLEGKIPVLVISTRVVSTSFEALGKINSVKFSH